MYLFMVFFYQLVVHFASSRLVLRFFLMFSASVCLFVGLCICAYYVHNNTSCAWLPCDFSADNLTAALNTGVVTVSSLAKLRV